MDYSQPLSLSVDDNLLTAWESVRHAPPLGSEQEIFPRFGAAYGKIKSMPRGARRALQRKLARSNDIGFSGTVRRQLAASIAGAALLLALSQSTQAATITVNTNIAKIAADGKCSLVEAIINANNDALTHADCLVAGDPGLDTIVLPPASAHVVAGIYDAAYGYTRLPAITSPVTIEGNGGRIQGTKKGGAARLIAVKTSGELTLQNITLSGGGEYNGGAIVSYGSLTIRNSAITGNKGYRGGGIYNAGDLTIENTLFSANLAVLGGAVFNHYTGNVSIQDSTITGNRASRAGVYNAGGILEIDGGVISRNSAATHGGGVMARGSFYGGCTTTIDNSTITGNSAHYDGGGIESEACTLTIRNSTISANKAGPGTGGVNATFSTSTIENSTISGNSGKYTGGLYASSMTISNSTITGNKGKLAGGVYNRADMIIKRSLISGNKGSVAEVRSSQSGSMTADNFNVFGINNNPGVSGFAPGASDIVPAAGVTITKILAPLADNGGPTLTHALVAGSPAIDASPVDSNCPAEDQRGVSRPQGALCDIGAFEK